MWSFAEWMMQLLVLASHVAEQLWLLCRLLMQEPATWMGVLAVLGLLMIAGSAWTYARQVWPKVEVETTSRARAWAVRVVVEDGSSFLLHTEAIHGYAALREAEDRALGKGLGKVRDAEVLDDTDGEAVAFLKENGRGGEWLDDAA